jgi:hypothetical protein
MRQNRKSWRLKFVDLDSSYSVVDNSTPISGFIVCRAPKGEQRAMYFGPQNSQAIDAMIGVGSANWPDILEAQAFNSEYGIYISAPPGTSQSYPSHLGGFYIAANGIYKFYNVTSKEELEPSYDGDLPPYKVSVNPTEEKLFDFTVSNTKIEVIDPAFSDAYDPDGPVYQYTNGTVGALIIHGLSPKVFNKLFQIDYDKVTDGNVGITLTSKWDGIDQLFVADDKFPLQGVTLTEDPNTGLLDITLGDFQLIKYAPDGVTPVNGGYLSATMANKLIINAANLDKLNELLTTGFAKLADNTKFNIGFSLQDLIHEVVNIQDDVYFYVMQKSLTERKTNIVLSSIEYDKYRYDQVFDYVKVNDFDENSLPRPTPQSRDYIAFYVDVPGDNPLVKIYVKASLSDYQITPATDYYKEATDDYATQYISFAHPRDFDNDPDTIPPENDALYHKIWYVDVDKLVHVKTLEEWIDAEDGDEVRGKAQYELGVTASPPNAAPKNPLFNTLTFSCTEEIYPGKITNGGSFTGSLDERGIDTYGTNIYFPSILSDDDFSYVECRVVKKFGDEADDLDNGFWTKTRVIDKNDMDMYEGEIPQVVFDIEGDRYCDFVMNMNLIMRRNGGVYVDEYYGIIKDGLTEALNPDYDDGYVFMEPTGRNEFAAMLGTIRAAQEFATVISPFTAPSSAISNGLMTSTGASKIIIPSRHRAVSRFLGEFEVYDPITLKKYWCQPIGDVGLMLARIIDKKLGVWSPSWMNVGDVGGQLSRSVLRSRYGFDDSSLDDKLKVTYILDQKGINAIAFNANDGLMILSSKTTEDPYNLTQWCYLEGQMGFDLCKRQIRDNVMRLQIKKPINDYYIGLRQTQVEAILNERLTGADPLWYTAVCDIKGVNDEHTKKKRQFRIKVTCSPTIFAEEVLLELVTTV